mgnify:CR=1 FL=1|jgi:hypothetical protein
MRGNIWTIVVLAVGLAMTPAMLGGDTLATDQVATDLLDVFSTIGPVLAIMLVVAVFGLFITLFSTDGF